LRDYFLDYKAFEVWLLHALLLHEFVEFFLHNALDLCVYQLHVTHGNGHDLAVHCIVHVTRHCGPCLDTLDMVKHEPRVFQISSWLHALDKVHTTFRSVYQHL
jgi:hypothetical protein